MNNDQIMNMYSSCSLCARNCGVDRIAGERGFCACSSVPHIVRADLHMWEEPIISGDRGSGTIFFSGCSLGCSYCQNREISRSELGQAVSAEELAYHMLSLERRGAHNVNFVTPTHHAPTVAIAIDKARALGLSIPVVYNTGSYDSSSLLSMLKGRVDVFLPDLKFMRKSTANSLSSAEDYPEVAAAAISEMVRIQPKPVIKNGLMKRGVIVRVLLLPGHLAEAKLAVKHLYSTYGDDIYISLMSQYTPVPSVLPPLDRRVTRAEYAELVGYAERLGVVNAFVQEPSSASSVYIPDWNLKD